MEETKQDNNIYAQYASMYIEKGIAAIPGKYGSKMPAIKNWTEFCHRLPNEDEMMSWFRNFSESNLDIALGKSSNIVALDLDCVDEKILEVILPLLPESPVVKKGSKGETRFFRYSGEISESLKFNGEMVIEILSTNKKTTMPPSRHPNGATYTYTKGSLLDTDASSLPILPPALFANIGQILRTRFPDAEQESYGKVFSGRNDELSSYCGTLIKDKLPIGEAISLLIEFDKEKNDPPLFEDQNEFRHTEPITNALNFYTNHLCTINNRHYRDNKEYEVPPIPVSARNQVEEASGKQKGQEPKERLKKLEEIMSLAPTVIKSLHTNLLKNSWIQQPELSLGAILTLMATLTSRKVEYGGLSPNLYVLNISPSGSGKDKPQQYVKEILINMRADTLLGSGDYVSDASLMDGLAVKPVRLDILDEAGGILRSVNTGKSEYNGKMADVLAELYTSSNTKYLGRSTAEGNKGACYRPNVNILASTTPTGFSEGVSRKAIEKGLMGRFIIFQGNSEAPAQRLTDLPKLDDFVVRQLSFWQSFRPEDFKEDLVEEDIGGITQSYVRARSTKEAEKRLDEIFVELDNLRRESNPTEPSLPIISRLYQQMTKVVIISAAARTIQDVPTIQIEDVEFAYKLIMFYKDNISEIIDRYIFENKTQMNAQKILNLVVDHGGVISMVELNQKTMYLSERERKSILESLESSKLLVRFLHDNEKKIYFKVGKIEGNK